MTLLFKNWFNKLIFIYVKAIMWRGFLKDLAFSNPIDLWLKNILD